MLTLNEALKAAGLPQKKLDEAKVSLDIPEIVVPKFLKQSSTSGGSMSSLIKDLKAWLVAKTGHDAERIDAWVNRNRDAVEEELEDYVDE